MYKKDIKICEGLVCGYKIFCDMEHPLANSNGWIYLHRHIASLKKGRWLKENEHVHHIDGNKQNNDPANIEVLNNVEHGKITFQERIFEKTCVICGKKYKTTAATSCNCSEECRKIYKKRLDEEYRKIVILNKDKFNENFYSEEKKHFSTITVSKCIICGQEFLHNSNIDKKTCSKECNSKRIINNRKFDISKEELGKLVWEIPQSEIAKKYGVSDKAIEKRCKKYGINKPPRGYWTKFNIDDSTKKRMEKYKFDVVEYNCIVCDKKVIEKKAKLNKKNHLVCCRSCGVKAQFYGYESNNSCVKMHKMTKEEFNKILD